MGPIDLGLIVRCGWCRVLLDGAPSRIKLIPVLIILAAAAGYVPDWLPRGPHILLSDAAHSELHSMPFAS